MSDLWLIPDEEEARSSVVLDGGEIRCGRHGHEALPYLERLALVDRANRLLGIPWRDREGEIEALARSAGITVRTLYRYVKKAERRHVCTCHFCGRVIPLYGEPA